MSKLAKYALRYGLSLGLGAVFIYWALQGIELDQLWRAATSLEWGWLGLITLSVLASLLVRAWRWLVLLAPFAPGIGLYNASLALAVGYSANVFIPRSGEALRVLSLHWTRGATITPLLGTVLLERILDVIWLLIFIGLSLLLLPSQLVQAYPWLGLFTLIALVGCVVALGGLVLICVYRRAVRIWLSQRLEPRYPRLGGKINRILAAFLDGLTTLHRPAAYLQLFVSSALLNLIYVAINYWAFLGMGLGLDFGAALVVMTVSTFGIIVPTPGGMGSYHLFFAQSLRVLYGSDQTVGLACALLVHGWTTAIYLVLGIPALLWQYWHRASRPTNPDPGPRSHFSDTP
ncbi:MAG: hypothetical protein GKR89_09285 [Candidatus Latescibacteria bacterium]|nr:hypothetical protein [Candidatus Latescibacterota bacterium]